jgi:acetyl esterase/lipase
VVCPILSKVWWARRRVSGDNTLERNALSTEQDVKQIPGIAYDHGRGLRLDLYLPLATTQPPIVVYLHGGSWLMGHRAESPERLRALAANGVAVASIDYRTVDIASYPAQHDDVASALEWVRSHADEYGLGPAAPFLMGSSAGAHLAALSAFRTDADIRISGLIGLFGRYNLRQGAPTAKPGLEIPEVIRASKPPAGYEALDQRAKLALLAGVAVDDLGDERLERLSPLAHASAEAPAVFLGHGTGDAIVHHQHSLDLAARLAEVGSSREVTVVLLPGANHEDDAFAEPGFARYVAEFVRRNQV